MNNRVWNTVRTFSVGVIAAVAILATAPRAQALDYGYVDLDFSSLNTVSNGVAVANTAADLPKGLPLTVQITYYPSSSEAVTSIFGFDLSGPGGTNFSTTVPITVTNAIAVANANTNTTWFVVPASAVAAASKIRFDSIAHVSTVALNIQRIRISWLQ